MTAVTSAALAASGSGSAGRAMWYLTRGGGLVALVALTATVVLGVAATVRFATPRWPRFLTQGLHRNLSLFVLVLIALHVATSVADGYAPIGWLDAVVPFRSPYRPAWLGLGALAFDVLLAVAVTSLVRQRLGYRTWRIVHWAAYASWPAAVIHGLGTGSDTRARWVLLLTAGCVAAVLAAVGWRVAAGWPARRPVRVTAVAASGVGALALLAWVNAGPLQPGWARAAGTPGQLLGTATSAPASTSGGGTTRATPAFGATPFTASLAGTLRQSPGEDGGQTTVTITGALKGAVSGRLTVVIQGEGRSDGGVSEESSRVTCGPPGRPDFFSGRLTLLDGNHLVAHATSGSRSLRLDMRVGIDPPSGRVSGTVQGTPG